MVKALKISRHVKTREMTEFFYQAWSKEIKPGYMFFPEEDGRSKSILTLHASSPTENISLRQERAEQIPKKLNATHGEILSSTLWRK